MRWSEHRKIKIEVLGFLATDGFSISPNNIIILHTHTHTRTRTRTRAHAHARTRAHTRTRTRTHTYTHTHTHARTHTHRWVSFTRCTTWTQCWGYKSSDWSSWRESLHTLGFLKLPLENTHRCWSRRDTSKFCNSICKCITQLLEIWYSGRVGVVNFFYNKAFCGIPEQTVPLQKFQHAQWTVWLPPGKGG